MITFTFMKFLCEFRKPEGFYFILEMYSKKKGENLNHPSTRTHIRKIYTRTSYTYNFKSY